MEAIDVSIVLAVKNEEIHIESALRSILAQDGPKLEVLVVDDGSSDDTRAIVQRMAEEDHRIRDYQNPKTGKVAAFNLGVSSARGAFVCLFAGDDLMPEGSLAGRWLAVRDRPSTSAVIGVCKLVTLSADKRRNGHVIPRRAGRGALSGVSYLMNHEAVARLFPVPETLPNEDTWLETAVTHLPGLELIHSDVIGCSWRIHSGNSINMLADYEVFNDRLTRRMVAHRVFYERHVEELTPQSQKELLGLIGCEESRRRGDVMGVLKSRVGLVAKLRALSLSNRALYGLRRRFYGLFSGW